MAGHTKGPWKKDNGFGGNFTITGGPHDHYVCSVQVTQWGPPRNWDWMTPEREANIQFLLAAPDMHDALRWLVNIGSGVGKAGGPPEAGEFEEALTAAKNVLAKAEGQAL